MKREADNGPASAGATPPDGPRCAARSVRRWRIGPGLALCVAVAAAATLLAEIAAAAEITAVNSVFVAIVLGFAWHNLVGVGTASEPGIRFASSRLLKAAIILLGLRFSLGAVAETGLSAVVAICAVIIVSFVSVFLLSRVLSLPPRLALLIGAGTAICGNSAIAACAPAIGAEEEEVAFASATITLFGTVAIVAYPLVGAALALSDAQFGLLAGAGIHDSAQAVASGFIFSAVAGGVATVVKLTRTAFLVPLMLLITFLPLPSIRGERARGSSVRSVIPWFVFGFLACSALRTVGDATAGTATWWVTAIDGAAWLAAFLIVVAMAGIGLGTNFARMKAIGLRPFYAGMGAAIAVGATALAFAALAG